MAPDCKTANSVDFPVTEHLSDSAGKEEPRELSPRAHLSKTAETVVHGILAIA